LNQLIRILESGDLHITKFAAAVATPDRFAEICCRVVCAHVRALCEIQRSCLLEGLLFPGTMAKALKWERFNTNTLHALVKLGYQSFPLYDCPSEDMA
jgi:hypothetical protein